MLTLTKALKTGRLDEFVRQEERRGVSAADRRHLDAIIKQAATTPIKPPRSKGRTSRSSSRGGSSGK